jgi:hypothetical protein
MAEMVVKPMTNAETSRPSAIAPQPATPERDPRRRSSVYPPTAMANGKTTSKRVKPTRLFID